MTQGPTGKRKSLPRYRLLSPMAFFLYADAACAIATMILSMAVFLRGGNLWGVALAAACIGVTLCIVAATLHEFWGERIGE